MLSKARQHCRPFTIGLIIAICNFALFGCAAGNFGFVRSVAKWNLKFSILPRVLIYIAFVIIPVYPIAVLLDVIIGNTIEFWTGSAIIHAGTKTFRKDGNEVRITHSLSPLRKTVIESTDRNGHKDVTEIVENADHSIHVLVNGVKRGEIKDIEKDLSTLLTYASDGLTLDREIPLDSAKLEGSLTGNSFADSIRLQNELKLDRTRADYVRR